MNLRFRIMTEANKEGNILQRYPEIADNTLNLVVPLHGDSAAERDTLEGKIHEAAKGAGVPVHTMQTSRIKHPFNGYFTVLSSPLR